MATHTENDYKENRMEKEIMNFIAADWRLDHLVQTMPQEYMDYIVALFEPPFELENDKDKEMMIFLYVLDRIRYMHYYGEEQDERFPELFWCAESILDIHPEYRAERFSK